MRKNEMKAVDIGRIGENAAARFLKKNKYKILEKNVHVSHNEIDIIARDKKYLVFVEVKTRTIDSDNNFRFGTPAMAVNYAKQQRTIQAARTYLAQHPSKLIIRFDVIEVMMDKTQNKIVEINHIINAFTA